VDFLLRKKTKIMHKPFAKQTTQTSGEVSSSCSQSNFQMELCFIFGHALFMTPQPVDEYGFGAPLPTTNDFGNIQTV